MYICIQIHDIYIYICTGGDRGFIASTVAPTSRTKSTAPAPAQARGDVGRLYIVAQAHDAVDVAAPAVEERRRGVVDVLPRACQIGDANAWADSDLKQDRLLGLKGPLIDPPLGHMELESLVRACPGSSGLIPLGHCDGSHS